MNEMNVGEVFYSIAKTRFLTKTEDFLHRLETLPSMPVSNTCTDVLEAARVKAQFPLSYADAFAISTAMRSQANVEQLGEHEPQRGLISCTSRYRSRAWKNHRVASAV
jgi:predicted nucleic acid-binding protein